MALSRVVTSSYKEYLTLFRREERNISSENIGKFRGIKLSKFSQAEPDGTNPRTWKMWQRIWSRTMDLSHLNIVVWKVIGDSFVGVGPILRPVAVAVPGPGPAPALLPRPVPQTLPGGPGGPGRGEGVRVLVGGAGVDILLESPAGVLASGGTCLWAWDWVRMRKLVWRDGVRLWY